MKYRFQGNDLYYTTKLQKPPSEVWYDITSDLNWQWNLTGDWASDYIPFTGFYNGYNGESSYDNITFYINEDMSGVNAADVWAGVRPTRMRITSDGSWVSILAGSEILFEQPFVSGVGFNAPFDGDLRLFKIGGYWSRIDKIEINVPLNPRTRFNFLDRYNGGALL